MNLQIITKESTTLNIDINQANTLLSTRQLDGAEMAWHEGLPNWIPLKDVQGITMSSTSASGALSTPTIDERKKFLGGVYHPWRRFFARIIDNILFGGIPLFILSYCIGYFYGANHPLFKLMEYPVLPALLTIVPIIPLEAVSLCLFGTTPGKFLYGIKVRHQSGRNLSFVAAFFRSIFVYVVGLGLFFPFVSFVTMAMSNLRLVKGKSTVWDINFKSVVTHSEWSTGRLFLVIGITVPIFVSNLILSLFERFS